MKTYNKRIKSFACAHLDLADARHLAQRYVVNKMTEWKFVNIVTYGQPLRIGGVNDMETKPELTPWRGYMSNHPGDSGAWVRGWCLRTRDHYHHVAVSIMEKVLVC